MSRQIGEKLISNFVDDSADNRIEWRWVENILIIEWDIYFEGLIRKIKII